MKNNQTGELPEVRWDRLLRIKTAGRDDSSADQYRYPYEPTPYSVLERLAGSGWIRKGNILLDYGCGKGRVGLFLSCQTRCRSIGVEYDPRIYEKALENQSSCVSSVDRVYFFNPFSLELLQKVMARILNSYYEPPRSILLFFDYPSDSYLSYLTSVPEMAFFDEIPCGDLFPGNDPRETIMIFELPYPM